MKIRKANERLKLEIHDDRDLKMGWNVWLRDLGSVIFLKSFDTRNEARAYSRNFKKAI
jgi:hypothetical protein